MSDGSEADRRREDSLYTDEEMVPEDLLLELGHAPVVSERDIDLIGRESSHKGSLTELERDIVQLVSHGMTYRMAAQQLGKRESTVKTQVRGAKAALNAKTVAHLVAVALRKGLIT